MRMKTYYGIPVPPWRTRPRKKTVTLVFVVTGRIPSKKNELVAIVDRRDAWKLLNLNKVKQSYTRAECIAMLFKTYARIKNSEQYADWEYMTAKIFESQLRQQRNAAVQNGLTFPLTDATIKVKFYWKGKHLRDNSNKTEGIHDALVKAKVIFNDSDRVLKETGAEAGDYTAEVRESTAVIYVTTRVVTPKRSS